MKVFLQREANRNIKKMQKIRATPKGLLDEWVSFVNEKNMNGLLALYSVDSVLIPTFSNRILNTPEKIRDYFEKLCSRECLNVNLHERTLLHREIQNDIYSLSGIYCWRFAVDGELLTFEAHFSYVINLSFPNPILHHHSSQIPRML